MPAHFIGIDVGTGSARAGVFDDCGNMLAVAKRDIALFIESGQIAEQSSEDIWQAVADSVQAAMTISQLQPSQIAGIGFAATCSLVVVGHDGAPLAVGHSGDPQRNIIVWMDHRALQQAQRINAGTHRVLDYLGGAISPEMETPKLLWLKENLPDTFQSAEHFFDLTDYLTWRATGSLTRSICTLACKWTYLSHEQRWDEAYFTEIGLGELVDEGFRRIGTEAVEGGTPLAQGLSETAAEFLGLVPGTPVGAGLIDAHAGGLGTVGSAGPHGTLESRMAYVFGTSACTMASTEAPTFVPGVWGPYFSAMVPGYWLNEGGQSAAGAAIDHLLSMHPAAAEATARAKSMNLSLAAWLTIQAESRADSLPSVARLADGLHVVPEFLGNRSPFADPHSRGLIAGLGMDNSLDSLVAFYVAGLCGLGYGLRQIILALQEKKLKIDTIVVSGGAAQAALVRQIIADTCGVVVAGTASVEPVLLGCAILGAVASQRYPDALVAMGSMSHIGDAYLPSDGDTKCFHDSRFLAFELLQRAAKAVRNQV